MDRKLQFAPLHECVDPTEVHDNCDSGTIEGNWGKVYENRRKDAADGEKTAGLIDFDGYFTNGTPAYIIAPEMVNINTGCKLYKGDEIPGIRDPGAKVCPLTTPVGLVTLNPRGGFYIDPVEGLSTTFKTLGFNGTLSLRSSGTDFKDARKTSIEAFQTHAMKWTGSEPPAHQVIQMDNPSYIYFVSYSPTVGILLLHSIRHSPSVKQLKRSSSMILCRLDNVEISVSLFSNSTL